MGKSEWVYREKEIALLAVGSMVETAVKVKECLEALGKKVSLINVRFVKPMDEETLEEVTKEHHLIVPMEEGVYDGGFCEAVAAWCQQYQQGEKYQDHYRLRCRMQFIEHGSVATAYEEKYRIDAAGIEQKIIEARIKESMEVLHERAEKERTSGCPFGKKGIGRIQRKSKSHYYDRKCFCQ